MDHKWINHNPPQAGKDTDWFSVQCLYAIVISSAAEMLYNQPALRQSPAEREQKLKTAYELIVGWRSHLPAPLQDIHKQDMHLVPDNRQMRDIALSIFRQYHEAIFMVYFPWTGSQTDGRVSEDYRRKSVELCVNSAQVVLAIANQMSNLHIFDRLVGAFLITNFIIKGLRTNVTHSKFLDLIAVSIGIIFIDVATRSSAKKSVSYLSIGCGIFGRLNILDNEVPLVDVLELTRTAQQITRK